MRKLVKPIVLEGDWSSLTRREVWQKFADLTGRYKKKARHNKKIARHI